MIAKKHAGIKDTQPLHLQDEFIDMLLKGVNTAVLHIESPTDEKKRLKGCAHSK
jgi:hypothetical protein